MPIDPTAVAGRRIVAWFIDGIIFVVIFNVFGAIFKTRNNVVQRDFAGDENAAAEFCRTWQAAHSGMCLHNNGQVTAIQSWTGGIWIFLALVVVFIVYQGLLGASVGKLAMGLRIVTADGSLARIGPSAIRTVLWIIDALTCGLPIIGGIMILSAKGHRRVGDMAAGTYVVPHSQVGHPVILPGDPGWGTYGSGPFPGGPSTPGYGQAPGYPQTGYGQPGQPVVMPPGMPPATPGATPTDAPTPWAPTAPVPGQTPTPGPSGVQSGGGSMPSGDYEADVPIWDDARSAYIQYDSGRAAWLEYDDATKEWKPIST